MSTRCQVQVIQEGIWDEKITLYHHCDGYPDNILPIIQQAYDIGAAKGSGAQLGLWELGRAGKVASLLCASDPGRFEPESGHKLHGDIEYYYRLYVVNKHGGSLAEAQIWEIEIFTTHQNECKNTAAEKLAGTDLVLLQPRTKLSEALQQFTEEAKLHT
jgi:hypothetical protein